MKLESIKYNEADNRTMISYSHEGPMGRWENLMSFPGRIDNIDMKHVERSNERDFQRYLGRHLDRF